MACRFITTNGKITGALNQNGEKSKLFEQLNEKYGIEKAVEFYSVSESDDFQELFGGNQNKITTELVTEYLKAKLGQDISILPENEMLAELEKRGFSSLQGMVEAYHGSPYSFDRLLNEGIIKEVEC